LAIFHWRFWIDAIGHEIHRAVAHADVETSVGGTF
jgi:hypothetical protein